jgi:murein DD-endopeptidase MepM/ murein hydrolase activator NlpD
MRTKIIAALIALTLFATCFSPVKAQDQTSYPVYIVQSGDTLASIANRFGVSEDDLISYNNISNPDFVSIGTQLIIPGLQGLQGVITTSPVQLGESLKDLTVKYQIDRDLLLKLNHVTSPSEIYAGSSLILPVVEESKAKVPVSKISSDQTILEMAAVNKTSTWEVLSQNDDQQETDILPGEMVYLSTAQNAAEVSPVDTRLTNVTISPLPLVQGQTFEITVDCSQPVTLAGSLNNIPLHFFSLSDTKQVALQGIHAMADPGLAPFSLSGTFSDGSTFSFEQSVLLISGNYPTDDPLTVDPALIDPKVTQPEEDQVDAITSVVTPTRYWSGMWQLPAVYNEYSATFGDRRTYNDGAYSSFHGGLDFAGGMGLPISAPAAGKVVFTGLLNVRGNATIIDHGWGVFSAYFHQSEIDVKVGDMVTAGQVIGKVGNTGRVNDAGAFEGAGSHLHFEVWVNGIQVDPLQWLNTEYP